MRQLQHVPSVRFSLSNHRIHEESAVDRLWQANFVFGMDFILLELAVALVQSFHQFHQFLLRVDAVDIFEVVDEVGVGLEVAGDEGGVNTDGLSLAAVDDSIGKVFAVHVVFEVLLKGLHLIGEFEHIDVVQVVKILSVEPTEGNHAAAHKSSAMPSSGFGKILTVTSDFNSLESVALNIDHQQIVEIVAEPPREDVDLIVVHHAGVTPAGQEG
jgi:hypothetical protein